ncbi:MAG TPA: zinc-binding dehydrogenase [Acidimicrobiales bacterium]|nr:zinc-binding dehydrogenase [Acidimicrobiales bacterium]
MKAAVYDETGGPEVLRYADVPDPVVRPGGVVIEVGAVGVQGGDLLHRQSGDIPSAPHIVGYQAAGVVSEVGEGVDRLAVGQPVVATMFAGSHAELVSVPGASVWPLPDGLSVRDAAGVPIEFATAHDCLFEFGGLQPGETVLIQAGAGGVGLAAVQLAKAAGATVMATASSDQRLQRLREYGLDHPINYRTGDVVGEVMAVTERRGVDLVVDPVGGRVLETSIAALAYRGRISWVGRAGRDDDVPDVWPIAMKNGTLTGVFLGAEMMIQPGRTHTLVADLLDRVASGELHVVIDRTYPLAEAADAHRYIESRQAFGRVLLIP